MSFEIRPVRLSYIAEDRVTAAWLLRDVLGMEIVRHEELEPPSPTCCPQPLSGRWCKTTFSYGPETTHFAVQQVYSYEGPYSAPSSTAINHGNDFVGAKIRSLEAIARAKAVGIEGADESEDTFHMYSKTGAGHDYWIVDHHDHQNPDPYIEGIMNVVDMDKTIHYWHSLLGIEISDLRPDQFSLFFRNGSPSFTFRQSTAPLVMSVAHLGFAMPRAELKEMSNLMMRSGTTVLQPFGKVEYLGRNSDYLVILKDPSGYLLHFYDEESFSTLSKHDPWAEPRFRTVLDMKVLRHIEVSKSKPPDTARSERFPNRWCKTVYGYGPETSHFGIVLVYIYRKVSCGLSNEWTGATIKSLPAIARAKAMGFPMMMQQRCPAENLLQPLCRISKDSRDADYLMILKDPNGFFHYFYDSESFEKICRYDSKAETRWELSVLYENKFQRPFSYFDKFFENADTCDLAEYIHS